MLTDSECVTPFVAFLLSPAHKVQRSDGHTIKTPERISTINELKEVAKILIRKDFLLV